MSVTAVVDPVTKTAQRLSPLLRVIRDDLKLPLTVVLAPRTVLTKESDIPLSSYYRFVADASAFVCLPSLQSSDFGNWWSAELGQSDDPQYMVVGDQGQLQVYDSNFDIVKVLLTVKENLFKIN